MEPIERDPLFRAIVLGMIVAVSIALVFDGFSHRVEPRPRLEARP